MASESNGTGTEKPVVPPGFQVSLFAAGLERPRQMRVAPNGDVFVVESGSGRIRVLRPSENGEPRKEVFAAGLNQPFGVSFYPPDADPQWVYVGGTLADDRFAKNIRISDAHFRLSGIFMTACLAFPDFVLTQECRFFLMMPGEILACLLCLGDRR